MKNFFLKVAAGVCTAAIIGNFAFAVRVESRLAVVESQLKTLMERQHNEHVAIK